MGEQAGIMSGFPPAPEHQVTLANWRTAPYNRWAFSHVSEVVPTAMVWTGDDARETRTGTTREIGDITFRWNDSELTVDRMLELGQADGIVVLRDGEPVVDRYFEHHGRRMPHILFSVTKSVTGLLAGILVERGQLDPEKAVTHYIPEAAGSGFGDATVRHVLDMTVALGFDEDYEASDGDMVRYRDATGWTANRSANDMGMREFLLTLPQDGDHGKVFKYCSPCTDLLGWLLERASDTVYADLLSEALWAPMGAAHDAYVCVDPYGAARAAGGLCTTTRDLARLGQMVLEGGRANGHQVVPDGWVRDIIEEGDREAWAAGNFAEDMPNAFYRSKWYKHGADIHAVSGLGIYGQSLYIHRPTGIVIAKHASQTAPLDFDLDGMQMAAFAAIASELG